MFMYVLIGVAVFLLFLIGIVAMSGPGQVGAYHARETPAQRREREMREEEMRRRGEVKEVCDAVTQWCQKTVSSCDEGVVTTTLIVLLCLAALYLLFGGHHAATAVPEAKAPPATHELEKFLVTGSPLQRALAAHAVSRA